MAEVDYQMALVLQHQFEQEYKRDRQPPDISKRDSLIAQELQQQFSNELEIENPSNNLVYSNSNTGLNTSKCLVDPSWEVVDPTPNVHVLFMAFDEKFFWKTLGAVSVSWSKRMTTCAGICSYEGNGGMCKITLSEALLKLRPRKDLVETLLHEMIHAYLFVTNNNRDRDGHGPEFHNHMYRINKQAGTNITVYHDFHDEVRLYKQHMWRCNGVCQRRRPYFGIVQRAMNRAPGPNDRWWAEHSRTCGGTFIKVKEPEKPKKPETSKKTTKSPSGQAGSPNSDIRKYFPSSGSSNTPTKTSSTSSKTSSTSSGVSSSISSATNVHTISKDNASTSSSKIQNVIRSRSSNIYGFTNLNGTASTSSESGKLPKNNKNPAGTGNFVKGAVKNNSNTIIMNKKPTTETKNKNGKETGSDSTNLESSVFSGTGHKIGDSQNSDINDYNAVRNHWLKKYGDNTNINKIATKRSNSTDVSDSPKNKVPKIKASSSSTKDIGGQTAECPICNKHFPVETINPHIDKCLESPKEQDCDIKECIICEKMISLPDYELHVSTCATIHFGDMEDVVEVKRCQICKNDVEVEEFDNHECIKPESNKEIRGILSNKMCIKAENTDTSDLLVVSRCGRCNKEVSLNNFDNHECKKRSVQFNDTIDCLVCGKKVLPSELNAHLDDCFSLNNVFDTSQVPVEQIEKNKNEQLVVVNKYNCPLCMKLFPESQMNGHLDVCLENEDDCREARFNKRVFENAFFDDAVFED